MKKRARTVRNCNGQSVAEYAVVLALMVIVAVAVLMGVGQHSRARLANVDTILDGHLGAGPASAADAADNTSGGNSGGGQGSENCSGSNQEHKASAGNH